MYKKFFVLILTGLIFSGCQTTTGYKAQTGELSNRIHILENEVNKKDREISRLYTKINNLSKKVEQKNVQLSKLTEPEKPSKEAMEAKDGLGIIRVNATPVQVQTALKNAGYYDGTLDGRIGPNTINAIGHFQKDYGLMMDSVIGQKTWDLLKSFK